MGTPWLSARLGGRDDIVLRPLPRSRRRGVLLASLSMLAGSVTVIGMPAEDAGASSGTITTIAGTGVAGFSGDGGPATSAKLSYPRGLAVAGGNLYIAANYVIRKVDSSGTITTIAGVSDVYGYSGDGGPATSALLYPTDVAVDGTGNVYIADTYNHRVRKVDTSGTITTVAGNGTPGYSGDGGSATSAKLSQPYDVALDSSGNLYIADAGNDRVRRVDTSGTITTVAGSGIDGSSGDGGAATSAQLRWASGLALDAGGNLYIADPSDNRVRKVDVTGTISTIAGIGVRTGIDFGVGTFFLGDGGPATSAMLDQPSKLAVDAIGNLYVADAANNRVRKVDTSGTITTVAGNGMPTSAPGDFPLPSYLGDGGDATLAGLNNPRGIELDGNGNLFIVDGRNHRVRKVEPFAPPSPVTTTTTSVPVTTTSTTLPAVGTSLGYPSDDCAGTAVLDGFVGDTYVKLRTGSGGGASWVCVALDDGATHVGGRFGVGGGVPDPPVDGLQSACDADPASRVRDQEGFVGVLNYDLDVNVNPNPTDAAWVCLEVVNSLDGTTVLAQRVVLSASAPSGTGFESDLGLPHGYVPAANPGSASSYCQANGGTTLVNADIGSSHLWAYTLSEAGGTRGHLCLRGQSGTGAGEHLIVDGGGGQSFVTLTQQDVAPAAFGVCTVPVFGNSDPYVFLKAGAAPPSAYGCVGFLSTNKLLTLTGNPGGTQTVVVHDED